MKINPDFKEQADRMLKEITDAQSRYVYNILADDRAQDLTRRELKRDFWAIIAKHYNLTIYNNSDPQPAPICQKCKNDIITTFKASGE
jgi:hypothetical protein